MTKLFYINHLCNFVYKILKIKLNILDIFSYLYKKKRYILYLGLDSLFSIIFLRRSAFLGSSALIIEA